jgi:phage tail sheath gpL-like
MNTPVSDCFVQTWDGCSSLSATSVENILNSIDTSGQSAPASVDITIDYNAGSGTPNITTAVTNLKSRGWTITLNGAAQ